MGKRCNEIEKAHSASYNFDESFEDTVFYRRFLNFLHKGLPQGNVIKIKELE